MVGTTKGEGVLPTAAILVILQPLASVTVTVYAPAKMLEISSVTAPLLQLKV